MALLDFLIEKNREIIDEITSIDFWSQAFTEPGYEAENGKYDLALLLIEICLIEPPTNVFAEGLGRVQNLILGITRSKMNVSLIEGCLNVYKNTPPLMHLGLHVLKLKDVWVNHFGKNALPTSKRGIKRDLERVFEREEPPKRRKQTLKPTASQRRAQGRWNRRVQKRKLFSGKVEQKYEDKDLRLKRKRRKLAKY